MGLRDFLPFLGQYVKTIGMKLEAHLYINVTEQRLPAADQSVHLILRIVTMLVRWRHPGANHKMKLLPYHLAHTTIVIPPETVAKEDNLTQSCLNM